MEVLPYMEQGTLASQYDYSDRFGVSGNSTRYYDDVNLPVSRQFISSMMCPSEDSGERLFEVWFSTTLHNYVVNYGNTGYISETNGPLPTVGSATDKAQFFGAPFIMSGSDDKKAQLVRLRQITDGLSSTLMMSEVIQGKGGDLRGLIWWGYGAGFTTYRPPNASQPDVLQFGGYCVPADNPPCVSPMTSSRPASNAARSYHPGGVQASRLDGSVAFVSDDISINIWRALSTTQGEEPAVDEF